MSSDSPSNGHEPAASNVAPPQPQTGSGDSDRLIAATRGGDGDAFAVLVDRYGPRIYAMLYQLVGGDAELAAELTQEAFCRAWERLDRFAGHSRFYTWLYRLARNRALDVLARKKPQAMAGEDLSVLQGGRHDTDALGQNELQGLVQKALAQLPAEQRELILLRDFDELDYATIAEHFSVPVGTIKSRLNRARRTLRDILSGRISSEDLA